MVQATAAALLAAAMTAMKSKAAEKAAVDAKEQTAKAVHDLCFWGILTVIAAVVGWATHTVSLGIVPALQLARAMKPFKPWSKLARMLQSGRGQWKYWLCDCVQ
ncbi:hypothetical protein HXX76_013666 [Chlamydomonas incerta]|uniref:Uncharacterized protein n=1 Tax=Chlamydomonas incerta TaxID=51695 RepID=A0A835VU75_CHLIN|nr:hypothetical protein HXX76_013666 [Chlamydomonas incerta]|eukprot:KAG2425456.1 hypothetical protein HXX76_013666 [Chlamydomonas incerta]